MNHRFLILFILSSVLGVIVYFVKIDQLDTKSLIGDFQYRINRVVQNQELDLKNFQTQFTIYSNPFDITSDESFHKRVYLNGRLIYWSDSEYLPDYLRLKKPDSLFFSLSKTGSYLVSKKSIRNPSSYLEIFSIYPLYENPSIINEYLKPSYQEEVFKGIQVKITEGNDVKLKNGQSIGIHLLKVPTGVYDGILTLITLLGMLSFFYFLRDQFPLIKQFWPQIGLLLFFRLILYFIIPFYDGSELFNPAHYTSGIINRSLGDLFLNAMLGLLIVRKTLKHMDLSGWLKFPFLTLSGSIILLHLFCYLLFRAIWDIPKYSLIQFDISKELELNWILFVAVMVLVIYAGIFYFIYEKLYRAIVSVGLSHAVKVGLFVIISSVFFFIGGEENRPVVVILFLGWGFTYLIGIRHETSLINYRGLMFSILTFSIVSALFTTVIYQNYEQDVLISKQKFANRLLIRNDILAELYLNQAIKDIQSDPYIRSRFFNRILARQNIKEKIQGQFLSSYFDKYEIKLYLFDSEGVPMGNHEPLASYESEFQKENYHTDYEPVYFITDGTGYSKDGYVCFIPITSLGSQLGTIVMELNLKKYIPQSVFPKLLVESRYFLEGQNEYDYAVFYEGQLIYKQGQFEFENQLSYEDLTSPKLITEGLEKNEVNLFGIKTSEGRTLVLVSPVFPTLAFFSNFSILLLILFFVFSMVFFGYRFTRKNTLASLSSKIQIYLGLSFLIPMLIVTIGILNTLNKSYKNEIDSSFQKKAVGISQYISKIFEDYEKSEINKDELLNRISLAADLVQSDINLYNESGTLIATSESGIFNLGLLSHQLDPRAYNDIKFGNKESGIFKQSIGELKFRSSFTGIRSNEDGSLIGIFSMPYFDSKKHLEIQRREVFNNLISIFTLILLITTLGGNLIITKLIAPLKLITRRLQTTNLENVNTPIEYDSDDELGALVREYNAMINKLEASKEALAEVQKETAWQEIARQVAHEIKNPLTPMRLRIQQLIRIKSPDDRDYPALNSLLNQIDTLSSIADSFSEFAKMPVPKNERVLLNALIADCVELYKSAEVEILVVLGEEPLFVKVDPKILSRVLTNIILNGIQSSTQNPTIIEVALIRKAKSATISVKDYGMGIPYEHEEKIFKPYFSTKTAGTGIGLSVAKKGIENAGGTLWFESEVGMGSTFFITLPLID